MPFWAWFILALVVVFGIKFVLSFNRARGVPNQLGMSEAETDAYFRVWHCLPKGTPRNIQVVVGHALMSMEDGFVEMVARGDISGRLALQECIRRVPELIELADELEAARRSRESAGEDISSGPR